MQQNEQEQQMRMKQNEQEHQMQMRKNELEHQREVQRMQQEMQRKQQEAEAQNRRVSLVLKNNHGAEVRCDGDFQTVTKIMSTTAFSEGANSYLAPPRAGRYLDHYVTDVYDDIPDAK